MSGGACNERGCSGYTTRKFESHITSRRTHLANANDPSSLAPRHGGVQE